MLSTKDVSRDSTLNDPRLDRTRCPLVPLDMICESTATKSARTHRACLAWQSARTASSDRPLPAPLLVSSSLPTGYVKLRLVYLVVRRGWVDWLRRRDWVATNAQWSGTVSARRSSGDCQLSSSHWVSLHFLSLIFRWPTVNVDEQIFGDHGPGGI